MAKASTTRQKQVKNVDTQLKEKTQYKLQIVDHILDNLHGQIGITALEKEIEKLAIFKRLHNISQLGVVNWIFPCAVHTRYVHSIGVMQMAYQMAIHINMNYGKQPNRESPFFSDGELQIIRLAGMLHDIGHYPLSHNIEAAYKEGYKEIQIGRERVADHQKDLVGCPKYLALSSDGTSFAVDVDSEKFRQDERADFLKEIAGSKGYHHEAIGAWIIKTNREIHDKVRDCFVTIKENGNKKINPICVPIGKDDKKLDENVITNDLLEMVAAIVVGNYNYGDGEYKYEFEKKYSAMVQIIHSELDADNLDYLLRDATFSGTSYGIMDVGVLLNCLSVGEICYEPESSNGRITQYLVGVLPKGIGCVEQFFANKYLAYSQMIYSKYVSSLEAMLLNWAKHSLPHNDTYGLEQEDENSGEENEAELFLSLVKSKNTNVDYIHFTDAFVLREIYNNYKELNNGKSKLLGTPDLVRGSILSRLVKYSSFELTNDPECLFVGFGEEDIRARIKENRLFQEYGEIIKAAGSLTMIELHNTACNSDAQLNYEKRLISFRFENYSMTKQLPFDEFCERIAPSSEDNISLRHYYRLATGIPILPLGHPAYAIEVDEDKCVKKDSIPDLVVDSPACSLNKTWKQRLVYLRKYIID